MLYRLHEVEFTYLKKVSKSKRTKLFGFDILFINQKMVLLLKTK